VLATKLTTAANAIFLQYVSPAIVLVLEPRILKTKMLNYNILTVIVCLLGLSFFLLEQKEQNNWWGYGLALLSGLFSACLILSLKASSPVQQKSGIKLGSVWLVLVTLPFFLKSPSPSMNEHLMLAFLGFVQIGFGYFLFTTGQSYISAIESSLITMLEPILNPIWVMIGYNEIPSTWSLIGGGIIITALIIRMLYLRSSFSGIKSD
jgi:drug/metabolite transporter (DMT)-like permease